MPKDWDRHWERVLQPGWQKRGPAIVRNKVYYRYKMELSLEEAEDLFSTTLSRVVEKEADSEAFNRDPEEARKILFGYLNNVVREWYRSDVVRRKKKLHEGLEPLAEHLSVPDDLAELVYRRALTELDDRDRRIFELCYLDGQTQTDVAQELGISLGTVNARSQHIRTVFEQVQMTVYEERRTRT